MFLLYVYNYLKTNEKKYQNILYFIIKIIVVFKKV